jgi:hypothetical protein
MTPTPDRRHQQPAGDAVRASAAPRLLPLTASPAASLRDVLEAIVADLRAEQHAADRVQITLDVPAGQFAGVDPGLFRAALEGLVSTACAAAARPRGAASDAPSIREVVVTSVESADAFELEIADSGAAPASAPHDLASARARATARDLARRCGGEVIVAACPEGGTAVTIRLFRRGSRQQKAA